MGHSLDVTAGFRVSEFGRFGQPHYGFTLSEHVGVLGFLNLGGQPIGALFKRLEVHAQLQHVVHSGFEFHQVIGLGEKVGGTHLQGLVTHIQLMVGRDHQQWRVDAVGTLAKLL